MNDEVFCLFIFLSVDDWARDLLLRSWNRETFSSVNCLFMLTPVIVSWFISLLPSCPFFLVSLVTHLFLFIYYFIVHWRFDTDPHIFHSPSLFVHKILLQMLSAKQSEVLACVSLIDLKYFPVHFYFVL